MGENGTFFVFFLWGIAGFDVRRDETCWDCSSDAEIQKYVGIFENSSDGPSTVALFLGVWGRTRKKLVFWGAFPPKIGHPQKF